MVGRKYPDWVVPNVDKARSENLQKLKKFVLKQEITTNTKIIVYQMRFRRVYDTDLETDLEFYVRVG